MHYYNAGKNFVALFTIFKSWIFHLLLCFALQYLPEIETTDYKNKRIKGVMQLIHFTSKVESKCWKGVVQPYFENDETLYQKNNTLQSTIANSKNIVLRVQIKWTLLVNYLSIFNSIHNLVVNNYSFVAELEIVTSSM